MSNQKKPQLSQAQIDSLTLDDLLGDLDPSKLTKAASDRATSPASRPQRANLLNREAEREATIADAARRHREAQTKLSPWLPEAAVLVVEHVTCSCCHSSYTNPAAETTLIRFRHRRNNSTWEVANHPSHLNPSLPREEKVLYRTVLACPQCFFTRPAECRDHYEACAERSNPSTEEPNS